MADRSVVQSGRYKAYPEYKDSGVELLGRMPSNWQVLRYKNILKVMQGMAFKSSEYVDKSNVVNIRMGNIKKGGYIDLKHNTKYLPEKYKDFYREYELHEGDAVIAMTDMSPSLDFLAVPAVLEGLDANTVYLLNQRVGKIILDEEFDIRFIRYWLLSDELRGQLKAKGLGTVQANMSNEDLYGSYFLCPSKNERVKIVDFLDYETAKIDSLIEKQQRLIELLTEKRQAVISHAVTKGLNPDVPMKDSGVEWLGDVPEHWDINKLRYKFDFGSGLNITKANLKETGVPCINYGEIHSKYGFEVNTDVHQLKCVDELYLKARPGALLNQGDFIFADTSEDIEGAGNFTQLVSCSSAFAGYHTVIARPKDKFGIRFYAYLLDSVPLRTQIRTSVKGVKVFSITQSILKSINIWIPPLNEREEIAEYLDEQTYKIDALIAKANQQIQLMQERRTALISAAVTGKIDVRDWVKPE